MCDKDRPPANVEDVWGEDSEEGAPPERTQLDREWEARHQQFYNTGYRDGLEAGKELTLQHGFDAGFSEGAQTGFEYGLVRGALQALIAMWQGPADIKAQLQRLLQQLTALPARSVMKGTCLALLEQPLSQPLQQQLQSALQQLQLDDDIQPPSPRAAVAAPAAAQEASGSAAAAAAASSSSSIGSSGQPACSLPQQLVAHVKQELAKLGFAVGSAPPQPAASIPRQESPAAVEHTGTCQQQQ